MSREGYDCIRWPDMATVIAHVHEPGSPVCKVFRKFLLASTFFYGSKRWRDLKTLTQPNLSRGGGSGDVILSIVF